MSARIPTSLKNQLDAFARKAGHRSVDEVLARKGATPKPECAVLAFSKPWWLRHD